MSNSDREVNRVSDRAGKVVAREPYEEASGKDLSELEHPVVNLSKLSVCFLAGTLGQGGAERQLFHVLRALRQSGATARVLCLERDEFWEERIRDLGVPVTWVGHSKSRLGRLLKIVAELWSDPSRVVQSQHFYTNSYVGVAARALRARSVGALRSNGWMEAQDCGRIGGWLNLQTPDVLAANSAAALRYALERGLPPSRLFLLPSVVDTGELKPVQSRQAGPLRLLAVGRLVRAKRFDRFIRSLVRLRSELKQEVTGIIVGAGPLKTELESQAAGQGLLASTLEFRGSAADIAPIYREADIFVMTSEYEGTPNVLLEAMASGLPVVATRVGGVPEVVQEGRNGLLVEAEDADGLLGALNRVIRDPELRLRLGKGARAYVEAHHSLECLPGTLERLYGRTVAGNRRARAICGRSPDTEPLRPVRDRHAMFRN